MPAVRFIIHPQTTTVALLIYLFTMTDLLFYVHAVAAAATSLFKTHYTIFFIYVMLDVD